MLGLGNPRKILTPKPHDVFVLEPKLYVDLSGFNPVNLVEQSIFRREDRIEGGALQSLHLMDLLGDDDDDLLEGELSAEMLALIDEHVRVLQEEVAEG